MEDKPKITYLRGRAFVEVSRLIFAAKDIEVRSYKLLVTVIKVNVYHIVLIYRFPLGQECVGR